MPNTIEMTKPAAREGVADGEAAFLRDVGRRVRELREQRGMARRQLAKEADVSERYLAQLEGGAGNISIVLLRRIALALLAPLGDLLAENEHPAEERMIQRFLARLPAHQLEPVLLRLMREFGFEESSRKNRIALIGLRGAGKSTLGSMLAQQSGVPFVELHREIERDTGLRLNEIFEMYGQSGYRRIERRCLEQILKQNDRMVLSLGGGVVSDPDAYKLLLSSCFTVWLKASPEEHMARVVAQGDDRPMAGSKEAMAELRQILAAREPLYGQADTAVDTTGEAPDASLKKLSQAILAAE